MKRTKSQSSQTRAALRTCKELNRVLTQTVDPRYQTHFFDVENGAFGRRGLIRKILKEHGAVWKGGIQSPTDRASAIDASMFTEDILTEVQRRFTAGTTRYPPPSIKACLGREMLKRNEVGRIQLSGGEDVNRRKDRPRPRCKWYLVED
jgi:hypothetical protein